MRINRLQTIKKMINISRLFQFIRYSLKQFSAICIDCLRYTINRIKQHKFLVNSTFIISIVVVFILSNSNFSDAAYSYWVQSDWSGGTGSSTTNQYSSESNLNTSTSGNITLTSTNLMTNNNFSTNLSGWNTGMSPNLISGLTVWLKADAIAQSNGTTVGTWYDSSGNGNNAAAVNAGILNTTGMNGDPELTLSGSDYYTITPTPAITTNSMSIFAVQKPNSNTSYGMLLSSNGTDDEEYDINYPANGQIGTYLSRNIGSGYNFTVGTPLITSLVSGSSTASIFDNGASEGTGTPDTTHPTSFHIGNYANGSGYYYNGSVSEIIIFNTALTNSQKAAVEDYLGSKYGISVSSGVTASQNTATTYNSDAGSAKLIANDTGEFSQNVTTNNGSYVLSSYAYTNGSAVTSSNAQLYYNGSPVTTAYTSVGSGWYNLTATVTGTGGSVPAGIQVVSGNTVYIDGMNMSSYATSGTLTSNIFNTNIENNWGDLTYADSLPSGTSIAILVRAGNQANLSDASAFTSCSAIVSGGTITSTCAPNKNQYVQYQVTLGTTNPANTPDLTSVSIAFTPSDITPPPTNASAITAHDGSGGASISSNGWVDVDPYFSWTAGADDVGGSGIQGYCLYLGQDSTGNPVTTKGDLGTSPLNTGGACQFAISATNIDTSISGYIGTALTSSNSPYYLNIKAIDNADNVYNGSPAQFEFMFDNTPPTNPAFITAPSEFVSNDQVTLTWPTTGGDAASDANSGIAGLQYRIGSGGTWYGANHTGAQDATDLLPNNGSYTTISNPDFANLVEGDNIVYFRSWDNAGNISAAYVTTVIKLNTTAPSSPQNLVATPSTNTTNSFGFSWLAPASFTGSASNIIYCYTVNTLPTSTNCTYTAAGQTSLSTGAYATEPGDNTLYLVAKDEAGNINYATAANVTFTANTPAPGIPLSSDIADISVKATNTWKLAISWDAPSTVGAGIASYKVFRSTDDVNYTQIASTAGTSYVDTGLSQQTYYYKVEACDSANNCGAKTDAVSDFPTGKFTSPANLISGPDSSITTRTSTINWTTDRTSDSIVEYGLSSGNYFNTDASNSDQVTSHSVELNSLTAGTTYYYRALWTDVDGNIGTSIEGSFTTLPAPTISNVTSGNIDLTNATIQFTANNASAVKLEYGGGVLSDSQTLNTSTNTSTYSIPLNNLSPGTIYTFRLNPYDNSGNIYTSPDSYTFSTPPQPAITNVEFSPVPGALTGTEQISWTTNVPTTSQISYGLVGGVRSNQLDTDLSTNHTMTISDLSYDTQYSVIATSIDNLGNLANSDLQIFKSGIDTRPPIISDIQIQPSITGNGASAEGQLIVSWKTDKPGTSQIAYGDGTAGDYSTKTAENTAIVNNHVIVISNLGTAEVYHLQAISNDADGIKGVSGDQTTIVGQASDSALSIVFNSLQSIFGL